MKRVTGLGGIFFKSNDPTATGDWYQKHLGIEMETPPYGTFKWRELGEAGEPGREGMTVWSPFEKDTDYFGPGDQTFMVNYCVENLNEFLEVLAKEGVTICPERNDSEYGRFAWIIDPEGRKVELWQPPKEK